MLGYELLEKLKKDFAQTGTAGRHVFIKDEHGTTYSIKSVTREEHGEEATASVTHWIEVEEM